MKVNFTEAAVNYLNGIINEFNIPEADRFLQLYVEKPSCQEVRYVLSDIQEEEWNKIDIGLTHEEFTIDSLLAKVLIRQEHYKYLEDITVDYTKVENKYAFTFIPKVDKLE